ncbi:MAG: hypothetical protein ACR2PT_20145 [Endozoicomonas sp.]
MQTIKPSHWSAALLALVLPVFSLGAQRQNLDVLFVAYDQGESSAFMQLEKALKKASINYRIITLGRAVDVFYGNSKSFSPAESRQSAFISDRKMLLDEGELHRVVSKFNPAIVYTGLASAAQAQLLNTFKSKGSYAIAFYDNFDPVAGKEYVIPFLNEVSEIDEYHVPSQATADSFKDQPQLHGTPIKVTGQPALEAWDEVYRSTDSEKLRSTLKLPSSRQVVLFAGGYDSSYEEYFHVFIESTRQMPNVSFLVTYHPKTSGKLERRIIEKYALDNVRLVNTKDYSSQSLSKIASAVVVHKSSLGTQALYKNKPVLYVAEQSFENFLIQKKLARLASTPKTVRQALLEALKTDTPQHSLNELGTPSHPTDQIINQLKRLLRH